MGWGATSLTWVGGRWCPRLARAYMLCICRRAMWAREMRCQDTVRGQGSPLHGCEGGLVSRAGSLGEGRCGKGEVGSD